MGSCVSCGFTQYNWPVLISHLDMISSGWSSVSNSKKFFISSLDLIRCQWGVPFKNYPSYIFLVEPFQQLQLEHSELCLSTTFLTREGIDWWTAIMNTFEQEHLRSSDGDGFNIVLYNLDLSYKLEWVGDRKVLLTRHGQELGTFIIQWEALVAYTMRRGNQWLQNNEP